MNARRTFLGLLSRGTAGLVATLASTGALASGLLRKPGTVGAGRGKLKGRGRIPEVAAESSTGRSLRFYDDLVKGKVVLINYMSIDNEQAFPVTDHMLRIATLLGPKLGSEVHIISITTDPLHDTPKRLRAFAARMGIPARGWELVRMSSASSALVATRFHRHHMAPDPHARHGVIAYGNEPVGLWGVFPVGIAPEDAVMRIAAILPGRPVGGSARRAGPRKLVAAGMSFNHRVS